MSQLNLEEINKYSDREFRTESEFNAWRYRKFLKVWIPIGLLVVGLWLIAGMLF